MVTATQGSDVIATKQSVYKTVSCSRRLCFSAGHRVVGHEGGCKHPHGHNYVVTLDARASTLDAVGRVIDFSVLKKVVGGWIEENFDHAFLLWQEDHDMTAFYSSYGDWKHFVLPLNPTAENIAQLLLEIANGLLNPAGIVVDHVRVEETENCAADAYLPRQ